MGEQTGRKGVNWGAVAAILTVVGWLLAAASGAFADRNNLNERVTVLETQRQHDSQRMERIENKVDRVLERLK